MTLLEIKTEAANMLEVDIGDFTVAGQDMFLVGVNHVRRSAEMQNDFEFTRKLGQLSVNGVTGGSIDDVVLHEDGTTPVVVKTVLDIGLFDDNGNLRPAEWTTVAESLDRQRATNAWFVPRYPRDGDLQTGPSGMKRFDFFNRTVRRWPLDDPTSVNTYLVGLEVYAITADWTAIAGTLAPTVSVSGTLTPDVTGTWTNVGTNSLAVYAKTVSAVQYTLGFYKNAWRISSPTQEMWTGLGTTETTPTSAYTAASGTGTATVTVTADSSPVDIWTTYGAQYLLWQTIVWLNKRFKFFVPRTEGNLAPPTELAAEGLLALQTWDTGFYESFRRHAK